MPPSSPIERVLKVGECEARPEKGRDFWRTPDGVCDDVEAVLGTKMVCDVCPPKARLSWYERPGDALIGDPWPENTFCNPPYSHPTLTHFVARAFTDCPRFLFLIPNATDMVVWHKHIFPQANFLAFSKGRVSFKGRDGEPVAGNVRGSALVGRTLTGSFNDPISGRWAVVRKPEVCTHE